MLRVEITPRKPTPVFVKPLYTPPTPNPGGVVVTTMFSEARRRDDIVKNLFKECPYKVGDKVKARLQENKTAIGVGVVKNICKRYTDLGRDYTWPETDNPMIVTVISEEGEIFFSTTNYLEKA